MTDNNSLETKRALLTLISTKWKMCETARDWSDIQHFMDGIWSALVFQGQKEAADDVEFLNDVAFERQYLIN